VKTLLSACAAPGGRPLLVGVVHLAPLPGAPLYGGALAPVLDAARRDAAALAHGCDAVIVENFGDVPFHARRVPPETVAAMALSVAAVGEELGGLPLGVNVLRNDAAAALGLCAATGASFLRVNVHNGAAVTDQGLIEGEADRTLRERARLAPGAALLADVHVKHASPLGREPIGRAALDALERGLADAVIVSGHGTGSSPDLEPLAEVRAAVGQRPVLIGSGLDESNAARLLAHASGAIVGTCLKEEGRVERPVDAERVRRMRELFEGLGGAR
jgi:membrane complex biogenesis BtpA family protein